MYLKIVEYRFSCEMEAHIEVTISKRHFNVCVPMSIIFFPFYAKIPHSWDNKFWGKSPVDSADTLWVKNFVEIALSHSVSEINTFFCILHRNSKWSPKVAGKQLLGKAASRICRYPVGQKFRQNCSISICVFANTFEDI